MRHLFKLLSVTILGASFFGVYYNHSQKYVKGNNGEYIDNYELFKHLQLSKDTYNSSRGFNERITKTQSDYLEKKKARNNKTIEEQDGYAKIKTIEDYSIKLVTRCGSGTGWFLDYAIPKDPQKYPTKWFIATNAHVISDYKFKSNPYKQELPTNGKNQKACIDESNPHTSLLVFKETRNVNDGYVPIEKYPEIWSNEKIKNAFRSGIVAAHDANKLRVINSLATSEKHPLVFSAIKEPRLFYVPINFLGNKFSKWNYIWVNENYYKDFAVLEIDFEDENTAKIITDNFYGKYHTKETTQSSEKKTPLNLFADEISKTKSGDELYEENENFFIAGYPANSYNSYRSFGNYSPVSKTASKLTFWSDSRNSGDHISVRNKYGQKIIGHVDIGLIDKYFKNTQVSWGGKKYNNWGYNYLLDNVNLSSGASGSLVTDSKGGVLGLYRMHDSQRLNGFVEPLRSEGIYKDGIIMYPKYDLIRGAIGQRSSYREQLENYYPKMNTYLRNRGWK